MSRVISKSSNTKSKFCKVCFDLGKSKEIYESHYVRETPEPNSKVACPSLLAVVCTCCNKPGHTIKYCSEYKRQTKERERTKRYDEKVRQQEEEQQVKNKIHKKPINAFAALCDDSDSDEETKPKTKSTTMTTPAVKSHKNPNNKCQQFTTEDFPQLGSAKQQRPVLSFSSIASQVYQEKEQDRLEKEEAELLARLEEINRKKQTTTATAIMKPVFLPVVKKQPTENIVFTPTPVLAPAPAPASSLFDRSEYLEQDQEQDQDLDISDSELSFEEDDWDVSRFPTSAKTTVVYDVDDFDPDW